MMRNIRDGDPIVRPERDESVQETLHLILIMALTRRTEGCFHTKSNDSF